MNKTLGAFAFVLATAAACKGTPTDDGPCKPGELQKARAAVASANPGDKGILMLTALAESCPSIPVKKSLQALATMQAADRATIAVAGLMEDKSFAKRGCEDDFVRIVQAVANAEPKDRMNMIYGGCAYEKLGVMSKDEANKAFRGDDGAGALMAHQTYSWLVDKGMKPDVARAVARGTVGLQ